MSNIPAAINRRLHADDHQPERSTGAGVITPCVGVWLGRGVLDRHYPGVNPSRNSSAFALRL
jgi:hypothetical protein